MSVSVHSGESVFVGSVQDVGDRLGVGYLEAQGVVKTLEKLGLATKAGNKQKEGKVKGKPATLYSMPSSVVFDFGVTAVVVQPSPAEATPAVAGEPTVSMG